MVPQGKPTVEVHKTSPKFKMRKTIETFKTMGNSNNAIRSTAYPESSKKSSKFSKAGRSKSRFTNLSGPQDIKSMLKTHRDHSMGKQIESDSGISSRDHCESICDCPEGESVNSERYHQKYMEIKNQEDQRMQKLFAIRQTDERVSNH